MNYINLNIFIFILINNINKMDEGNISFKPHDIQHMLKLNINNLKSVTSGMDLNINEIEIKYTNVNINNFNDIEKYLNKYDLRVENSLEMDIIYIRDKSDKYDQNVNITYRASLIDENEIKNLCNATNQTFLYDNNLKQYYFNGPKNKQYINKFITKSRISGFYTTDIENTKKNEYNMKLAISEESDFKLESSEWEQGARIYRIKNRKSYFSNKIRIDMTIIKSIFNKTRFQLSDLSSDTYEVEIEFEEITDEFTKYMMDIWKIINKSKELFPNSHLNMIKSEFANVFFDTNYVKTKIEKNISELFPCPNVRALTFDNYSEINENYYISLKADGFHGCLFLFNRMLFFVDQNLNVIYLLNIPLIYSHITDEEILIFECEIIDNDKILIYDFISLKVSNKFTEISQRLILLLGDEGEEVINSVKNLIKINNDNTKDIREMYYEDRIKYIDVLLKYTFIDKLSSSIIIKKKELFDNIKNNRVELISQIKNKKEMKSDGMIFTNKKNIYPLRKDKTKFLFKDVFKYKLNDKLSIDLRIRFNYKELLPYNDVPVELYASEFINYKVSERKFKDIMLKCDKDAKLRTEEDNKIIINNNIVEFIYDNNKWTPIKIRYEKDFPNNINIVEDTYKMILNPLNIIDTYYEKTSKTTFNKTINSYVNAYHNKIKIYLINTCKILCGNVNNLSIIDFACGVGGDFLKYKGFNKIYGFEYNLNNLIQANDRIVQTMRNKVSVDLICADLRYKYNDVDNFYKNQLPKSSTAKIINIVNNINRNKVNIISCQFALHYMFDKEESLDNMIYNIKYMLKKGGYFIFTIVSGDVLNELFDDNLFDIDNLQSNHKKITMVSYRKEYTEYKNEFGQKISVLLPHLNESYIAEYIIPDKLLESKLGEDFNLIKSISFMDLVTDNIRLSDNEKLYSFIYKLYIYQLK